MTAYRLIAERYCNRVALLIGFAAWAGAIAGLALGRLVWG